MDKVLQIGSQTLIPIGDTYRFVITETMPHVGYKFKFGIPNKILKEILRRGRYLEVTFGEHPEISFTMNPLRWMNLGEVKEQVGNFKNLPMKFYWFYVSLGGEVVPYKQAVGQESFL